MTPSILITEDDVAFARMLESFLSRKGYDVTTRYNGQEALAAMGDASFDLLITDLKLPDTSGIDLLDALREKGKARLAYSLGY